MNGVNKAILVGTVGKDAQLTFLDGGGTVATFTLATNGGYKKKDGTKETYVDWHTIEVWNETAKFAGNYIKKGTNIYVEGEIKTDKYQDKESGKDVYRTKIKAYTVNLLPSGNGGNSGAAKATSNETQNNVTAAANATAKAHEYVGSNTPVSGNESFEAPDDDLPF